MGPPGRDGGEGPPGPTGPPGYGHPGPRGPSGPLGLTVYLSSPPEDPSSNSRLLALKQNLESIDQSCWLSRYGETIDPNLTVDAIMEGLDNTYHLYDSLNDDLTYQK